MTTGTTEERLGARPVLGESAGCARCGHPVALHSNGRTACKAFACTAGPKISCGTCGGTTRMVASGDPCETCDGTGSVATPCQGFVTEEQEHQVALAS